MNPIKYWSIEEFEIASYKWPLKDKINKVYNKITLSSVSQNKFVKFNITNNPDDVIPDVYYTFPFTVKII